MPRTSVISAFINDNASGGGGAGPDGTQYYVELTVQSSQVSSDLTNFPVYVDLSTMPAGFFTNVQSDGGDIRITESDGVTRCAVDLVSIDTSGSTGELHFLSSTLFSSSNTTFRIYYGTTGTSSQPEVTTTYGRNAVWAGYEAVYHLENDPSGSAPQIVDATGNGYDLTTAGSMASGDKVTGKLGSGINFDGSNDVATKTASWTNGATELTYQAWAKPDVANLGSEAPIVNESIPGGTIARLRQIGDLWDWSVKPQDGELFNQVRDTAAVSTGSWYALHGTWNGSGNLVFYIDGVSVGNTANTGSSSIADRTDVSLAKYANNTGFHWPGTIDEVRVALVAQSADWIAAEYTNQNTPTTFYTVGSQTSV